MADTKTCRKCGESKPATTEFFHSDKTHGDGLKSQCRDCRSKASAETKQARELKARANSAKAVASRNAMLRLIKNHRMEFDAILKTELMVTTANKDEQPKIWKSVG